MTYRQAVSEMVMRFAGQSVAAHMVYRPGASFASRVSAFGRLDAGDADDPDRPTFLDYDGNELASFYLMTPEFEFLPSHFSVGSAGFLDAEWNPGRDTLTFRFEHLELVIQETPGQ
jgi:hypothetical protein